MVSRLPCHPAPAPVLINDCTLTLEEVEDFLPYFRLIAQPSGYVRAHDVERFTWLKMTKHWHVTCHLGCRTWFPIMMVHLLQ